MLSLSSLPTERKVAVVDTQWFNPLGHGATIRLPIGTGQSNGIGSEEFHSDNQLKCGIDLTCGPNFSVHAVESGTVVSIETFFDNKRKPWVSSSKALLISGRSGVVCYGNINPDANLKVGSKVFRGDSIGFVTPFFSKPSKANYGETRLRIELYRQGTNRRPTWHANNHGGPKNLLNPIPHLLPLIVDVTVVRRRSSKLAGGY